MSTREDWQLEADLLAEGREVLERHCAATRYRHLFPTGPNMALLLRAYQELDRWRTVRRRARDTPRARRRDRRRFFRLLKHLVREDALARDRRLLWHYPLPRPQQLRARPPEVVIEALLEVDTDVRAEVAARIHGRSPSAPEPAPEAGTGAGQPAEPSGATSLAGSSRVEARTHRGLEQFREALINAALAHPTQIPRLHPQYIQYTTSPQPTRRKHPVATMLLVKLPLQLLMILVLLFNVVYLAAYHFFNDERLGAFLTDKVGGLLDGQLAFGSLHWSPMLVVDLLTGQPHTVHGYDIEVWEPYKIDGLEKSRRTAYAEHLEVELVIHEIIPWNRLGVPKLVEIPWVLHFEDIQNHGELWFSVRSYKNPHRNGEWMLSLIDAFDNYIDLSPPPHLKKLSYRIDHADLPGLQIDLDLENRSGWATEFEFEELELALDFEAWAPIEGRPETLPLRYEVSGRGGVGNFTISAIHDGPISITEIQEIQLASGMNFRPIGNLWVSGEAALGGSPSVFEGQLIDVFDELTFDFELGTTNVGPLAEVLMPPKEDDKGRLRSMINGEGSPAQLQVSGPVDDIVLQGVGQGLTLDLFPEPAWALDDVDVSLTLARDTPPEMWVEQGLARAVLPEREPGADEPREAAADQADETPKRGEGADDVPPEPVDDGKRWVVYLDTFRGSALDGSVRLHHRSGHDHVVLPQEGEPWLISVYLDMVGVNLAQFAPSDPELAAMLAGSTSGGLQVHEVIIGDEGLDRVAAELNRVDITRDRGPADDHLPRNLRADGEAVWDAEEGLDLRGLRLAVEGGQLRLSGGVDAEFQELRPTSASIRVDKGEAFLRAFGLPRWFDTLSADFTAHGPLKSPRGSGVLDVSGAGSGALAVDDIEAAKLSFDNGTLSVRSPDVALLGGRGPLSADLVLLARGEPLEDPRLRLDLRLEDIDRENILGSQIGARNATVELIIDDGDDKPVRLSELHARGGAYAEVLTLAGVDYRNAEASFAFTREGIEIDRMTLAYHRPVSPVFGPGVTVPVGRIGVTGTVGFDEDPSLALAVEASNLPLSALAATTNLDLPIRGQIAQGSNLAVTGSLRRPDVRGQLVLRQLGAAGVPLGGGVLQFSSADLPWQAADPEAGRAATAAHREVTISGSLAGAPNHSPGEGELDWRIDGTVAFGGGAKNRIEAALDLRFANLPLDNLLSHPSREQWKAHVVGGLQDLVVRTRYCPSHEEGSTPLLDECAELDPNDPRTLAGEQLQIDMSLANLWYRGRREGGSVAGVSPCLERDTTCSINPLVARLDGSHLSLDEPWQLRSGGKQGPTLTVDGTFDLTEDEAGAGPDDGEDEAEHRCVPNVPDNASLPPGASAATLEGALDFSALAPILGPMGVESPDGKLEIDLDLSGVVTSPTVTGYVRLPADQPLALDFDDGETEGRGRRRRRPVPVEVSDLDLRMAGGTVYIEGGVKVFDETIRFGDIGGRPTFVDIAGPCAGRFSLGAAGSLDGELIHRLVPSITESSGGAVELREFRAAGDLANFGSDDEDRDRPHDEGAAQEEVLAEVEPRAGDPLFDGLQATLSFERKALRMVTTEFGELRLASGLVELRQCTAARPCAPRAREGESSQPRRTRGVAIWIGGQRSAQSRNRPSDALGLRIGDRGRAELWGELVLADDLSAPTSATVTAYAKNFPLTLTDNSGRTELEAELSSERLMFETDATNGRISGEVIVERSTWLRDARQGVAVLSFADPHPAPPSQLPEFIRGLELDMSLRTAAPFRVDNNVAKKLEAHADLRLGGTVGDPDLSGPIDVERGVVDIDILGGAYDVARGRVILQQDLSESTVDVAAIRQKQIKVNNQLLTLNLHLGGTLDAIQWECTAPGDTSGALATTRGCVDYLIFDAGNVDLASSDIRETRNNNNLLGTRFLPLAGRLTQVELNDVLEREAPRIEQYMPLVRFRVEQPGVLIELESRPEWLRWGWGRLGVNFGYVRGYPGSVIRDSRSLEGRLEFLENTAIEAAFGNRNYTNRVFIIDPPTYQSIQFIQRLEIPSAL